MEKSIFSRVVSRDISKAIPVRTRIFLSKSTNQLMKASIHKTTIKTIPKTRYINPF